MFKLEDVIICGKYGVCKVDEIGPVSFGGGAKNKMYYTLVPVYDTNSKAYVPVENDKIIMRPVMSEEEAKELISDIEGIDALWISEEKKRESLFKEAMYKYDCRELIKIIKAVYIRKRERTAQGKKVTMNDERYLHTAEENLYGELAVALKMDKDEVRAYILERFGKSVGDE